MSLYWSVVPSNYEQSSAERCWCGDHDEEVLTDLRDISSSLALPGIPWSHSSSLCQWTNTSPALTLHYTSADLSIITFLKDNEDFSSLLHSIELFLGFQQQSSFGFLPAITMSIWSVLDPKPANVKYSSWLAFLINDERVEDGCVGGWRWWCCIRKLRVSCIMCGPAGVSAHAVVNIS